MNKKFKVKLISGAIVIMLPFTIMVSAGSLISSTVKGFFGDKNIEETFSEEDNKTLKQYLIKKVEEVNNYYTFQVNGTRIGKMNDINHNDIQYKLNPAYVQAYAKYRKLDQKYDSKYSMDAAKKEIDKAAEALKPKFIYKNDEIKTVKVTHKKGPRGEDTTSTETSSQAVTLIVTAENVENTYEFSYKTVTDEKHQGDTTIYTTKPVFEGVKEKGTKYDNLRKAIKDEYPEEDLNKAVDAITTLYENYKEDYSSSMGLPGMVTSAFIPLFLQWDSKWADYPYSSSNLAATGCGPTCLAMVVTGLEGNLGSWDRNGDGIFTPDEAANFSTSNGGVVPGSGTVGDVLFSKSSTFGLNCRYYSASQSSAVLEELKNGCPVIANVHGSEGIAYGSPGSTFTQHGHFIVLTGVDATGKVTVNDPNNRLDQSSKSWDFMQIIVAESTDFWAFDNPNMTFETFVATAYTGRASEGSTDSALLGSNSLAGKDLRNKYIAVDPSVIKLGSMVYIKVPENVRFQTMPDGTVVDMNGAYTAVDTGNAIQGHGGGLTAGIDFYFGTGDAYVAITENNFGRQNVLVRVKK